MSEFAVFFGAGPFLPVTALNFTSKGCFTVSEPTSGALK